MNKKYDPFGLEELRKDDPHVCLRNIPVQLFESRLIIPVLYRLEAIEMFSNIGRIISYPVRI